MVVDFRAVHASELLGFLERIGKREELEEGNIHCAICDSVLDHASFGGVCKENGELRFLCSRVTCLALPSNVDSLEDEE